MKKTGRTNSLMDIEGTLTGDFTSVKRAGDISALTGLTGTAVFRGGKMETTMFKARIGQSDIQGKFRVDDCRKSFISFDPFPDIISARTPDRFRD